MKKREFKLTEIGTIHSQHIESSQTPIQPVFCKDIEGSVVIFNEYIAGLKDLEYFSHIYLFYYFDRSQKTSLVLKPYLSEKESGIFATRAPHRPSKLGMSLVRLDRIEKNILYIRDIDILDNTPLLDIKPYIKRFDSRDNVKSGWQDMISNESAAVNGLRNYNNSKK
jgi:tRNA-Thr(GGU) m(6)t(6)A37 methyltransferase TsaA